ncbi:Chromatin assembly factor 1 subunit [Coemansia sp. Benny D115]|nr:Chromatin assembly factor 1 subunit [Coemansia sp. Benny D115]
MSLRVKTVQINWHEGLPIFSVDFDHSFGGCGWRFATGGGDNNVRIWRLCTAAEQAAAPHEPAVEFLASLNRHTAPVNVVRFAPDCSGRLASAGDDGVVIIWRRHSDPQDEPETWRAGAMLRGSLADICDLAWSPCGRFLASASVDNTARIWDAQTARCLQVLADHQHYVQGVAWDPLGQFLATQSSDRSLRVYRWLDEPGRVGEVAAAMATHVSRPCAAEDGAPARTQRLFHDDNLASFFRRPSVSPDGRLVATAAGVQRGRGSRNTCLVWARDRLQTAPVLSLAGHAKPVVACRWAPCRFEARSNNCSSDGNSGWVGGVSERMMLAVASQNAVALYDTSADAGAVGLLSGLHYAALADLAWTADGSHLVVVSLDGFASVARIDQPTAALPLEPPEPLPSAPLEPAAQPVVQPATAGDSAPARADPAAGVRKRVAPTLVGAL